MFGLGPKRENQFREKLTIDGYSVNGLEQAVSTSLDLRNAKIAGLPKDSIKELQKDVILNYKIAVEAERMRAALYNCSGIEHAWLETFIEEISKVDQNNFDYRKKNHEPIIWQGKIIQQHETYHIDRQLHKMPLKIEDMFEKDVILLMIPSNSRGYDTKFFRDPHNYGGRKIERPNSLPSELRDKNVGYILGSNIKNQLSLLNKIYIPIGTGLYGIKILDRKTPIEEQVRSKLNNIDAIINNEHIGILKYTDNSRGKDTHNFDTLTCLAKRNKTEENNGDNTANIVRYNNNLTNTYKSNYINFYPVEKPYSEVPRRENKKDYLIRLQQINKLLAKPLSQFHDNEDLSSYIN